MTANTPTSNRAPNPPDLSEFKTIKGLVETYPDLFTEFQIRWAIRHRSDNGLQDAVVKLGRSLYIHVPTFTRMFAKRKLPA